MRLFPFGFMSKKKMESAGNDKYTKLLMHFDSFSGLYQGTMYNVGTSGIITRGESPPGYAGSYKISAVEGEYFTYGSGSLINFATGNFTIECWVKFNSLGKQVVISKWNPSSGTAQEYAIYKEDEKIKFTVNRDVGGGTITLESNDSVILGDWYYVAGVRSGNYFSLFINGVSNQYYNQANIVLETSSTHLVIGTYYSTPYYKLDGYVTGIRISDINRNPSEIQPSTTPKEIDGNTLILANVSSDVARATQEKRELKFPFATTLMKTDGKFGQAINLNGSKYVEVTNSVDCTDFDFGEGDWTVDWWMSCNTYPPSDDDIIRWGNGSNFILLVNDTTFRIYDSVGYTEFSIPQITLFSWFHYAITRSGNELRFYSNRQIRDGVKDVTGLTYNKPITPCPNLIIGDGLRGYIDEIRVSKGIARWTGASFVLPTEPYS